MLDSLTLKNKKELLLYIAFSLTTGVLFIMLAFYSYGSLINYKNETVSSFYYTVSDPIKTSATAMTRQLIFIIIDGLGYEDANRLKSLNKFKEKSAFCRLEILQPSISAASWMTFITGAPPQIHGFISPIGNKIKYAPCENIFSSASGRTFQTAIFGHDDWKKLIGKNAGISYYAGFNAAGTNIIQIDSLIMSNAMSYIRNRHPQFALIHLPGLDKTSHLFGRASHEFKVHLQKLDDILNTFLTSSLVNDRYIIITSDHGHILKGGHGGGEPEVINVPFMIAGPEVIKQNIKFMKIEQTDICPTICSLLGVPLPYLNAGSFLGRLFSFDPYIKTLKMKAVLYQKSAYYKSYLLAAGAKPAGIFEFNIYAAEIDKITGGNYQQALLQYENHEKNIDIEFKKRTGDIDSYKKLYRFFYLGFITASFLFFLFYKFQNHFRFFSSLTQIIIFYSIYYGIYFFHGYNFSLSDFNSFDYFNSFMNNRRIEIVCALLLSYTPLILNFFFIRKRLITWLNYVFYPVFIEFNYYLVFTIVLQCSYYILHSGPALKNSIPDMSSALKYYFDIQIIITTQAVSLIIASAAYLLLTATTCNRTAAAEKNNR